MVFLSDDLSFRGPFIQKFISSPSSFRTSSLTADKLSKAGWTFGCVSAATSEGRIIWIADAHRGDGQRFVVHAGEKLNAFLELKAAILRAGNVQGNLY
jgi:hypothetical protein